METLSENDTLGCKKWFQLRRVAFCIICPAVTSDEDSINDDSI